MKLKQLGSTGVMVPEIGMGFWRYGGGLEPITRGLEAGATLLDTAEIYGTEEVVGQALRDCREQVFVATKVAGRNLRYDEVLRAAEGSLRRLDIGRIDLYQIHWPNPAVPIRETMRAMEALVDRGLVRFIGVSQFSLADLRVALGVMKNYPIVSNQVRYSLSARRVEADLLPYCEEHQISLIAYTPLADGRLANPRSDGGHRMQMLKALAKEAGHTPGQVALNWCTAHPAVIAIPKSDAAERVTENCAASGWRLSAEQVKRLNRAFSWKYQWIHSRGAIWWRKIRGRDSVLNQSSE